MFQLLSKQTKWALALVVFPLAAHGLTVSGSYFEDGALNNMTGDINFGMSVAISGDEAIVSAPFEGGEGWTSAMIYRFDGARWALESYLAEFGSARDFGAYLGCTPVAIEGDIAAIGRPSVNSDQGDIEIFRHTGIGWEQEGILEDSAGLANDGFGCSIAISDGHILVGAPNKNGIGQGYIYSHDGELWKLDSQLMPSDASARDGVGFSGSMNGDEAVLGAPHAISDRGTAYVFKKFGSTWKQIKKLSASDGAADDQFGASVAISNGTVIVGAPDHTSGEGAAYVFGGASLVQQQKLSLSGTSYYGAAVAIDGNRLAVSRLGNDAVDMFFRHGTVWSKGAAINGTAYTRFGGSVAVSGPMVLIGAYGDSGGRAYLLKDDWIFRDQFQ